MSLHPFLTNVTGLVGQYLLRDLLLADVPMTVLTRSRNGDSGAQRVEALCEFWEQQLGRSLTRPLCVEGDITEEGLGLDESTRRWLAQHCTCVVHSAASLTFAGSDRTRDPWLTNYTGTQNLLDFCSEVGLRDLHHISTAYVCGQRTDRVFESELDHTESFRNDYEHCKYESERLVRKASFLDSLTVYRPSTIVGDSQTGYTSTYHAFYAYLQAAWLLVQHSARDSQGRHVIPVRLNVTGSEPRNLIPVEWVSAATVAILRDPKLHGKTYHLTPVRPVTAAELEEAMSTYFNYTGPTFVGYHGVPASEMNEMEQLFYEYVARYQGYWSREPLFDSTNTLEAVPDLPCPDLSMEVLHRLIAFAFRDRWGKGSKVKKRVLAEVTQ